MGVYLNSPRLASASRTQSSKSPNPLREPQMAAKKLAFLFLSLSVAAAAADGNNTEFILRSCGATRYPRLCFQSMAVYASAIQDSPVEMAHLATNLTLSRIGGVARRVTQLLNGTSGQEAAALSDCAEMLGLAADEARRTVDQLAELATATGPEVAMGVSNAQTWMSGALTNEETCTDGFDGVGPGPLKTELYRRLGRVKHFTSNALALVDNLVAPE